MTSEQPRQLLLDVNLDIENNFDSFLVADSRQQVVQLLKDKQALQKAKFLALWGQRETGKTHLLQALCHQFAELDQTSMYLPFADKADLEPAMLTGLEQLSLVCLDDIDQVLLDPVWEQAVFNLLNLASETPVIIVVAASIAPAQLQVKLKDLQSRLQLAMVFHLKTLNDTEKAQLLLLRAARLGIELSEAEIDFILRRSERSISALIDVLQRLDQQSLELKRRVTVPLIKQVMGW